ncbi:hypothetical protein WDV81_09120 [Streptococcus agalactiae]
MPLPSTNYMSILFWAVIFGLAMRSSNQRTKDLMQTFADATSQVVKWIINLVQLVLWGWFSLAFQKTVLVY